MALISTQYIIKEALNTIQPIKNPVNRQGEYAVITGGNRGIGWHTVKKLVDSGMKVIVGCRPGNSKDILFKNMEANGIPTESVEWIGLDMSSLESIKSFAQAVLDKNVPVSLLINNAGIMFTPYTFTKDGFESQFAVNYLGHFLLTHLLMPRLVAAGKADKAARIINVSSSAHSFGCFDINDLQGKAHYNEIAAYSQSKACQIMFTKVLDEKLIAANKPVRCYALHPGFINSGLYGLTWYAKLVTLTMGFMFKNESQGADRVMHCALASEVEELGGSYFENCEVAKPIALVRNRDNQQNLWDLSCQLVDVQSFGNL